MAENETTLGETGHEDVDLARMQFTNLQASRFVLGDLEHPNKMPFSGILTYFDVPSDNAPHGSTGRKVMIPSEVGIPALDSLIGMAVNYLEGSMNDHDPTNKIGVITEAWVDKPLETGAVPVNISGFIYAFDFEQTAVAIKLNQASLGFSYETANTRITDGVYNGEPVAVVTTLGHFTGASILYADKAAYTNTSLAASSDDTTDDNNEKEGQFSVEGMKEILDAIQALKEYIDVKFEHSAKDDVIQNTVSGTLENAQEATDETADQAGADENAEQQEEVTQENATKFNEEQSKESAEENTEQAETQDEETPAEQPQGEEANLNAAAELVSVKSELEAVKAELASLKASADVQAAARKSLLYPTSLVSKYEIKEEEGTHLMASIDNREDLTVEERLALKFELRDKARKEAK